MGTVGGASGALYGRGFQRAGASLAALDGAGASGPAATREIRASAALAAAVDAIGALGRAAPGEKTMLDDSSRPATRARRPSGRVPARRCRVLCGGGRRGRRGRDGAPPGDQGPGELPGGAIDRPPRSRGGVGRHPAPCPGRRRRRGLSRRGAGAPSRSPPHDSGQCLDDSGACPVVTFLQRCRRALCADRAQTVARPGAVPRHEREGRTPADRAVPRPASPHRVLARRILSRSATTCRPPRVWRASTPKGREHGIHG